MSDPNKPTSRQVRRTYECPRVRSEVIAEVDLFTDPSGPSGDPVDPFGKFRRPRK